MGVLAKQIAGQAQHITLPDEPAERAACAEVAELACDLAQASFGDVGVVAAEFADDSELVGVPDEVWRQDDSQDRFIQFSFEENWFCLDLPLQTLYQLEAAEILRSRNGFFYLRDRPEFTLKGETVDGYDPFRKIYIYGDERSAAEDMAFILFNVWRFPIDWRFYVKAAAFGDKPSDWEDWAPVE